MGCNQATPKVENVINKKPPVLVPSVAGNQAIENQTEKEVEYILRGVYSIKRLKKSHPVICYSDKAFPIINDKLYDEEKDEIGVVLPIIAGCTFGEGRILYFGNSEYTSASVLKYDDTQSFVNNCINWLRLPKLGLSECNIFILGFNKQNEKHIEKLFQKKKYHINTEFPQHYNNSDIIIMSTSYDIDSLETENVLIEFVNNGGRIIFMHQPENNHDEIKIGELLLCFGIATPECSYIVGNSNNKKIEISKRFKEMAKITFTSTASRYINYIQNDNITIHGLDTFIMILRIYLDPLNPTLFYAIKPLFDATMKFFIDLGYDSEGKLSADSASLIALVLLTDIYFMFTPEDTGPALNYDKFPGPFPVSIPNVKITRKLQLKPNLLVPTGLYLSPHETGSLEVEGDVEGIKIQIGSHPNLGFSELQYQRLPVVTCRVELSHNSSTLTNPFGGLIYVMCDKEKEVNFTFSGVVECPYFDTNDTSIWDRTSNSVAPWGEIVNEDFLISVPTTVLRSIPDLKTTSTIQLLIKSVKKIFANFLSSEINNPIRYVFEWLTDGMHIIEDNTVMLDLNTATEFLSNIGPTELTFDFVWRTSNMIIQVLNLSDLGGSLVSDIAAAEVFSEFWPDCAICEFPMFQKHISFKEFEVLWNARKELGESVLKNGLQNFQVFDKPYEDEEDIVQLVLAFSQEAKVNFFPAFVKLRPLPFQYFSKRFNLNGLPEYNCNCPDVN